MSQLVLLADRDGGQRANFDKAVDTIQHIFDVP